MTNTSRWKVLAYAIALFVAGVGSPGTELEFAL